MNNPLVVLSEERWIRAARQGDVDAFNRLVEAYQDIAFAVALRTTGHPDDAADATQEAFLDAFRSISRFRGGSFRAWLVRIVVNACYDLHRSARRRPALSLDGLLEASDAEPWTDGSSPDPEGVALTHETRAAIERALAALPDEQRLAIELVDVQGFSYEESAEALGCAVGTIRSRLARGRARVRDVLSMEGNL
ncbi:MAG TPA: sigma-70 family RNA polymerase sigma factor [Chloroflexota bacterium]|nr:sigma-70 family RNA polymerase sigma factor [Chloroflexota bacterium]